MTAIPQQQVASCDARILESPAAAELYITATPASGGARGSATETYTQIASLLRQMQAVIVQERLFASADAMPPALYARAQALGDFDDGVPPTLLATRGEEGRIMGIQVHAIRGIERPRPLHGNPAGSARVFNCNGSSSFLTASGLRLPEILGGPSQARKTFEAAADLLQRAGATLGDVARTWVWMDDILTWYPQFNQARTAFFRERGLLNKSGGLPASTGIGVTPAGARVALDLFAAWGRPDAVTRFHASGNQRSAYEYGSAFARAARVITPGGTTVFCSGTAAIDAVGKTCFVDDIPGQIRMTLDNVLAVLRDTGCSSSDVVQALAYCATPQAEDAFLGTYRDDLPWPWLTLPGEVCRPDLLFEVEVTACPAPGGYDLGIRGSVAAQLPNLKYQITNKL